MLNSNKYNQQTTSDLKNEDYEMLFCSLKIGCSIEELALALASVGVSEAQVKLYLKMKKFSLTSSFQINFENFHEKLC